MNNINILIFILYIVIFIGIVLLLLLCNKNDSSKEINNDDLLEIINNSEDLNDTILFDYNDCDVYLINMVKRKNRLDNFVIEFNNSDLNNKKFIIFPAIDGKEIDASKHITDNAYQNILKSDISNVRQENLELTRGAIGCYLSHLGVYKKIAKSNANYGLIFEDDVIINKNTLELINLNISMIPNDWDIYLLGLVNLNSVNNKTYLDVKNFWCTHAYIIKKRSAIKLLKYLDKLFDKQIDAELSLLVDSNKIKIYASTYNIVNQNNAKFDTDIQIPVKN